MSSLRTAKNKSTFRRYKTTSDLPLLEMFVINWILTVTVWAKSEYASGLNAWLRGLLQIQIQSTAGGGGGGKCSTSGGGGGGGGSGWW